MSDLQASAMERSRPEVSFPAFLRLAFAMATTLRTAGVLVSGQSSATALQDWACSVLRGLGVKLEINGRLEDSPGLWVANHLSWLDPLILLSLRPMGVLAKGEVTDYPLIGGVSRRLGLIFVDREDALSRAAAVVRFAADLGKGRSMLLFPEGTTTTGDHLAPIQEGGLRTAFRCGTAVQTIRLSCADPRYPWIGDDSLLPHLVRIAQGPLTVRLETGHVLDPGRFSSEGQWVETIRQHLTPIPRGSLDP